MSFSFKYLTSAVLSASLLLSACKDKAETVDTPEKVELTPSEVMAAAIKDPRRADDSARDIFRNPQETLEFFGVEPGMSVAEIWPGYYAEIMAPYFKEVGGTYVAVLYPDALGERAMTRSAAFKEKYADTETYGTIQYGTFGYRDGESVGQIAAENSLDMILTFRNVHNWMGRGYADQAFEEFYAALKPGGTLGVVEHRLPESRLQNPQGQTGYVQESYMKDMATRAGFEFVDSSEVNANPLDTADHPFGVWTLPPRSRLPEEGSAEAADFDAESYRNIGESDRATLRFRKPG